MKSPSDSLPPPAGPTDALPGSAEKIEVLRLRQERDLPLWHPDDAKDSIYDYTDDGDDDYGTNS